MAKQYPNRHENHNLEAKSNAFFLECLPKSWNVNTINKDYGQDYNLEIPEDGLFKGSELIVQLKSSHNANINY